MPAGSALVTRLLTEGESTIGVALRSPFGVVNVGGSNKIIEISTLFETVLDGAGIKELPIHLTMETKHLPQWRPQRVVAHLGDADPYTDRRKRRAEECRRRFLLSLRPKRPSLAQDARYPHRRDWLNPRCHDSHTVDILLVIEITRHRCQSFQGLGLVVRRVQPGDHDSLGSESASARLRIPLRRTLGERTPERQVAFRTGQGRP